MRIQKTAKAAVFGFGGSGEIRTHGGLLTLDGFQDRCIKPLCHASLVGSGGNGGIRTHGGFAPSADFESAAFSLSATFPSDKKIFKIGGSGEIRTHGGLSTLDGFQDRCIKPLCHASVS